MSADWRMRATCAAARKIRTTPSVPRWAFNPSKQVLP